MGPRRDARRTRQTRKKHRRADHGKHAFLPSPTPGPSAAALKQESPQPTSPELHSTFPKESRDKESRKSTAELYRIWTEMSPRERSIRYPKAFVSRGRPNTQLRRKFDLFERRQEKQTEETCQRSEVGETDGASSSGTGRGEAGRGSPRVVICRPAASGSGSEQVQEQARTIQHLKKQVEEQRRVITALDAKVDERVKEHLLPLYEVVEGLKEALEFSRMTR